MQEKDDEWNLWSQLRTNPPKEEASRFSQQKELCHADCVLIVKSW